ncbi:CASP-like protein 1D1 [Magnolia sinica]|uniref:CASP-like protein 1D1 n=1 Tax=Magnolia sinica TaxID=86752 RepID=UPI00265A4A3E|nr:CASP-like protein 1D1 [Magnolia sinica]
MASSDKLTSESIESAPNSKSPLDRPPPINFFVVDLGLRLLLFASTITAIVVMATSKQTKVLNIPLLPFPLVRAAKFNQSPALIYYVVALSAACFYSIITILSSLAAISKTSPSKKLLLLLAYIDTLMVGVVASAMGAASSIGYLGLKGNSHAGWTKVCNIYGKFCRHVSASISISLIASIILILLVFLSTYSLYRRSH